LFNLPLCQAACVVLQRKWEARISYSHSGLIFDSKIVQAKQTLAGRQDLLTWIGGFCEKVYTAESVGCV